MNLEIGDHRLSRFRYEYSLVDIIIHLPTGPASPTIASILGAAAVPEKAATPAPDLFDALCDYQPQTLAELVARLGEVILGEPLPAALAVKIERFLDDSDELAKAVPAIPKIEESETHASRSRPHTVPVPAKGVPPTGTSPRLAAPAPRPRSAGPRFSSPEFKQRVAEVVHALMCVPEYQLS